MKTTKTFDVTEKARIYHTTAQLTSSFSSISRYCEELEQAGVLTSKYRNLFQAFTMDYIQISTSTFLSTWTALNQRTGTVGHVYQVGEISPIRVRLPARPSSQGREEEA